MRRTFSHRFSITLADVLSHPPPTLSTIIDRIDMDSVFVPIWPRSNGEPMPRPLDAPAGNDVVTLAAQLLDLGHEVIITLDEVPAQLAETLNIDLAQVLAALGADAAAWRPYLDEPMLMLGLEARRWQVSGSSAADMSADELARAAQRATASLGAFVPDPQLIIAWPILRAGSIGDPFMRTLEIPREVRPGDVPSALEPWLERPARIIAHFQGEYKSLYTPRQRIDDLALRTLHAWRAGTLEFLIDAPWSDDADHSPMPELVVWRTLADQLSGRRYVAELNDPDIADCWIVEGAADNDAAMIAWADARTGAASQIDMLLADGPVTVVDVFGNVTRVLPTDGRHRIALGETPVFIEGINLNLALFRAGFTLQPQAIKSAHRLHEVELVLRNPWDIAITGVVRMAHDDDWHMNPRINAFSIAPGGEARLPVDVVFDRNVLSDRKTLQAEVTLRADRQYDFQLSSAFEIGTDHLHVSAQWQIMPGADGDADDLIITQYITNRSDRAVTLSAFMHAPGQSPRVRPLGHVGAGESAVQTFRVAAGAATLAGAHVRYGVREVDGSTRVNRVLKIPDLRPPEQAAAPTP
jgi:hypothetical protein